MAGPSSGLFGNKQVRILSNEPPQGFGKRSRAGLSVSAATGLAPTAALGWGKPSEQSRGEMLLRVTGRFAGGNVCISCNESIKKKKKKMPASPGQRGSAADVAVGARMAQQQLPSPTLAPQQGPGMAGQAWGRGDAAALPGAGGGSRPLWWKKILSTPQSPHGVGRLL